MFTIQQIKKANERVKSGADFPLLARELYEMGVRTNDVYVSDGRAVYFDAERRRVQTPSAHSPLEVAAASDSEKFTNYLKIHQQGQTDYPTFLKHCAETGIEKWTLDFAAQTCAYFDKRGNTILTENFPMPEKID